MSNDIDLRAIDQRFEPDAQFRTALRHRLIAIENGAEASEPIELPDLVEIVLQPTRQATAWARRNVRFGLLIATSAAAILVTLLIVSPRHDRPNTPTDITPEPTTVTPEPTTVTPEPTTTTTVSNGWVSFAATEASRDHDIYVVQQGSSPRRILGSAIDRSDEVCPAFSPDGARLVFGQAAGNAEDGYEGDAALVFTTVTADGSPTATTTIPLDGVTFPPCAIWSADGRWVAFGVSTSGAPNPEPNIVDQVWVVHTEGDDIRRLTGLSVGGLRWSPVAAELLIEDHGVLSYSVVTEDIRAIGGGDGAGSIAPSPDGETIAFTRDGALLLMDADGTNERVLVEHFQALHGLGPVWSPNGERIAYQRTCEVPPIDPGATCGREGHEVVILTLKVDGPGGAEVVSEAVIRPPRTTGTDGALWWFPWSVFWSPDGTELLYLAWPGADREMTDPHGGIVAVPVDGRTAPVVLSGDLEVGVYSGFPWLPIQSWGRQPSG